MSETRHSRLVGLLRDQRGAVIVTVAVAMTALMAVAGVAIDGSHLYVVRTKLQAAADSAALAAAVELPDQATATSRALAYAAKNMPAEANGVVLVAQDVTIGLWDGATRAFSPGGDPPNAVRVVTRRAESNGNPAPTFFARVLGYKNADVVAEAIAAWGGGPLCMIALDPSGAGALHLDSNARVHADCGIHVNSTSSSAIRTRSNAVIDAAAVCVAGGYDQGGNSVISPTPTTGCPSLGDPLAGLEPPTVGACDYQGLVLDDANATLQPGVYCGGLQIKNNSNVTFAPGIYVIKDNAFQIDSNSRVQGDGVSFYLDGDAAVVNFRSNTIVRITAPTSGPLAGIVLFHDRYASGTPIHRIYSNSNNKYLEGAVYFPAGKLLVNSNGTVGGDSPCMLLIAHRFEFDSNSVIEPAVDFENCSVPLPPAAWGGGVRLVR